MELAQLQQLVEQYGKVVYAFCYQLTGSQQDCDELYQDTFLKAVELHQQIDAAQNPKGFLIAIAARLWRNRSRKYAWRQRIAPTESIDAATDSIDSGGVDTENPETAVLRREQQQIVRQAVAALPDKLKIPLYMYYTAELSTAEIAQLLRIPQGTVKSRLHKARSQLKEKLEVCWYEAE